MKRMIIPMICIAIGFTACKKSNDSSSNTGTFNASISNGTGTWSAAVLHDTLYAQLDTETNGGTNLVPQQKILHIWAKASDSSSIKITLKDYIDVTQGSCLRTVAYLDANYAAEYANFGGNKYYTTASVTYTINSATPKVYVGDSGVVNITSCSNGTSVSGNIQYRLHNTAAPNDTIRITTGSFTGLSCTLITYQATVTANVDAVPWVGYVNPDNANDFFSINTDGDNNNFNDKQLVFQAEATNGKVIKISIFDVKNVNDGINGVRTTTYNEKGASTDTIHNNGNTYYSYVKANYDGKDDDHATATITSVDATNRRVSGTFSFHTNSTFGSDHTITTGAFNNVSYRVQQ